MDAVTKMCILCMSVCSRKYFQEWSSVYSDDHEDSKFISSTITEDSAIDCAFDSSSSQQSSSKQRTIVFRDKASSRYIYTF